MKKIKFKVIASLLAATLLFTGCGAGGSSDDDGLRISVGATAIPHTEILEFIREDLAEHGITLEITTFSAFHLINPAVYEGQVDANFFQHLPFLENYIANSGHDLVSVAAVHIEPMGIYSSRISSLDELPDGAVAAIPNDATNGGRALLILEYHGLIGLRDGVGFSATPLDIVYNPKNLQIQQLEAAVLPRALDDTYIALINTNIALAAGLHPATDAIAIETTDSDYANIVVVRAGNENLYTVQRLVEALTSERVRTFIEESYGGAVVPAF